MARVRPMDRSGWQTGLEGLVAVLEERALYSGMQAVSTVAMGVLWCVPPLLLIKGVLSPECRSDECRSVERCRGGVGAVCRLTLVSGCMYVCRKPI